MIADRGKQSRAQPKDFSANSLNWDESNGASLSASRIFTSTSFEEMGLHSYLCSLLKSPVVKGGFEINSATIVQQLALPVLLKSQSVDSTNGMLIKSQTGSGKTLAYLLPIIQDLMLSSPPIQRSDGTLALIIAPTRELCSQIFDVLERLTKVCVNIVPGSISGGEKKKSEKSRLRKGVTVLVGTPGRLLDHMKTTESFVLSKLRFVVVDEVDRLFDMGFDKTMKEILSILQGQNDGGTSSLMQRWQIATKQISQPQRLRSIMVSATLTPIIQQHALMWMRQFVLVDADALQGANGKGYISSAISSLSDLDTVLSHDMPSMIERTDTMVPTKSSSENGVLDFGDDDDQHVSIAISRPMSKVEDLQSVPTTLRQFSVTVGMKWRLAALLAFLRLRRGQKMVVFFSTCDSVDFHALLLRHLLWPKDLGPDPSSLMPTAELLQKFQQSRARQRMLVKGSKQPPLMQSNDRDFLDPLEWRYDSPFLSDNVSSSNNSGFIYRLHGKVPQHLRRLVVKDFARSTSGILLCTDVAARGLDLPLVQWIVQYDPPSDTADYVHRIGRTARRGAKGSAVLFLLPTEQLYLNLLSEHGLQLTPLSSQSMLTEAAKEIALLQEKRFKNVDELCAVALQRAAEGFVAHRPLISLCAIQAYRSFLRAYGTRSADCKGIFKLTDLHLGHAAKVFALHDKPSDFSHPVASVSSGRNKNGKDSVDGNILTSLLAEDIVGKVFNGDYASPEFRERQRNSQVPAKSSTADMNADSNSSTSSDDDSELEDIGEDLLNSDYKLAGSKRSVNDSLRSDLSAKSKPSTVFHKRGDNELVLDDIEGSRLVKRKLSFGSRKGKFSKSLRKPKTNLRSLLSSKSSGKSTGRNRLRAISEFSA